MMLARWNPWQDLWDMQREMSELLRRGFGSSVDRSFARELGSSAWSPAVDVLSRDGDLVVRAELPGVDPDKDIEILVQDGVLHLRGERRHQARTDGDDYFRVETAYGSFRRSIPLPEGFKPEDVRATYENGILEVVLPKAAELSAPKRIPIKVGTGKKALTARGRKK